MSGKTFINLFSLVIIIFSAGLSASACVFAPPVDGARQGYVSGRVTDAEGNPLAGVKIIVDHSIFYNSNLTTSTNSSGNYRLKVPTGSWYAFAVLKKTYNGRNYTFYLEPDSYDGFGGEGATRNFVWSLKGEKQEPLAKGFFGGTVTFDRFPSGTIIEDENDIEFTFVPAGELIDGSRGKTLKLRSKDGYQLFDIPIGRYEISASFNGRPLGLRKSRTDDEFSKSLRIDFEPQIDGRCDNCFQLEYYY